ncbi:TPA: thioesterase family protein [Escherichia coli]|nr:thioesterase family protein [Escherichia coli]HCP1162637.1 thioesterase family protein [Escherichia coli]HCQ3007140.1 thioesterase family protein [Escherichia coli]
MSAVLTAEQALKLVGEMFVYHMPFNRALGMELERYEKEFAQLAFKNQPMMVGNWAQSILHGGVIASALDVAAGLVCVGSTLTRHETISEDELRQRLSRMGTIDLRVDYLRPGRGERFTATSSLLRAGRGERFTATSSLLRAGNKVAVARVELHNEEQLYIASATATYMVG